MKKALKFILVSPPLIFLALVALLGNLFSEVGEVAVRGLAALFMWANEGPVVIFPAYNYGRGKN